jgi:phosphoglycerate dehydrogenase-like enzyme
MKTLIAICNPDLKQLFFSREVIRMLESFSEIHWIQEGVPFGSSDLADIIGEYDACITSWGTPKFTPEVLRKAERLKFIGHAAGSVVAVVNDDIFDKGIMVTNANKPLSQSTAEAAVALMLAGAWDLHGYNLRMKDGGWSNNNRETVMGLQNQTVGLIGYGEISRHVVRLLKGFQPKILLYSRYCTEEEAAALGVELCSLDHLLANSQIVSLHSTWTPETEGMVGREQLRKMQDGALFVNTARGAIVDEDALVEELMSGRLYAALDVYRKEPLKNGHPLLSLPNVICLPHIGGFHRGLKSSFGEFVVNDLIRFTRGEACEGQITRDIYKRLTPR